jgi:hypothetical protein
MTTLPTIDSATGHDVPPWLAAVIHEARSLQYGLIEIVFHDGDVTQVGVTSRTRFSKNTSHRSTGASTQHAHFDPATRKVER